MVEAVNQVSNLPSRKSKVLPLALAGVGIGAVSGGLYGFKSNPWIKSGELTDTFVTTAGNKIIDEQITRNTDLKDILKSLKGILNLNIKKDISEENLIKLLENNAEIFEIKPQEGEALTDAVKGFIKKEGGKDNIVDSIFKTKEMFTDSIKEFFDLEKSKLKPLKLDADLDDKKTFGFLEETIKDFNKKAAVKWAAIGAAALAVVGVCVGLLANKNKNSSETKNANLK